jgi:hypothetical protein
VTTTIPSKVKKSVETPIKDKVLKHEPSPRYTTNYMLAMDHSGKIMVKYIELTLKRLLCGFQQFIHLTYKDPNLFEYLNSKVNLFRRPTPPVALMVA